jgi:hypothetical protein
MKQRGELASKSDAESDQDDADEGMRSDTEANMEQEANGTGDTKAKVRKGRKRKREAGAWKWKALARGDTWHRMVMAGQLPLGAAGRGAGSWRSPGQGRSRTHIVPRWLAASCQCDHTRLPSRRRLA